MFDVMRKLWVQERFFQDELRKSYVLANILDAIEIMIEHIEGNAAKISKTPFKMENLLQHLLILLINFVTQSKKNQKYWFERVWNSKIIIDSVLAFPDIIKYFIIFIYNTTSQSLKRRRAFILEKYGIQIFKKIFKILIYEHKKIEWVEEDKRVQEKRK